MTGFPFRESLLAEGTGIAPGEFRKARKKLARGLDWEVSERAVWYSVQGFYGVLVELRLVKKNGEGYEAVCGVDLAGLQKKALAIDDEKNAPIAPQKGRIERFLINRFYLAVRLSDGRLAQVFAGKTRDLYRKGQTVELEASGPAWKLVTAPPRRPRQA